MPRPRASRDVTRPEDARSLAEAVRILRRQAGSHDRLAEDLGTTRQTIIRWEKGVVPRDYRDALIKRGVPAQLFFSEGELGEMRHQAKEAISVGQAILRRLDEIEQT